jgi:hypothetical protein
LGCTLTSIFDAKAGIAWPTHLLRLYLGMTTKSVILTRFSTLSLTWRRLTANIQLENTKKWAASMEVAYFFCTFAENYKKL